MRLLLDTHIFLWACDTPEKLKSGTRQAIESETNAVFVSAATAWEIAIKCAVGRMGFPLETWDQRVAEMGIEILPITAAHAFAAGALPNHHADPFDRMLIAQAGLEGLILVSDDRMMRHYNVALLGDGGG